MDPLEQAAQQLLRAAEIMARAEQASYDQTQAATSAGWWQLGQRSALFEQRGTLQGQASLNDTAGGRQLLAQQAQLRGEVATLAARTNLQQAQAQAAYMGTPAGRAESLEQARLAAGLQESQQQARRLQQNARESVAIEQNVLRYGQLGAAAFEVTRAFSAVRPGIGAAVAAFGQVVGLAGRANPNVAATYEGSVNLVKAQVGSFLTPAVDAVSHNLQRLARALDDVPARRGISQALGTAADYATRGYWQGGGAAAFGEGARDIGARLARAFGASDERIQERSSELAGFGRGVNSWMRGNLPGFIANPAANLVGAFTGADDALMRSGRWLAQPSMGTAESYYRQSQESVLAQGPLEAAELAVQMRNLYELLDIKLTAIADNQALTPEVSSFR